jgi:hypothetical protein
MADQNQPASQRETQAASQPGDAQSQVQRTVGQRPPPEAKPARSQAAVQSAPPGEGGGTEARAGSEPGQAEERRRSRLAACRDEGDGCRPGEQAYIDAHRAIRVGFLQLARNWADEGHVYSAINTYKMVLKRYPCSGVAAAAVEELLDLACRLEDCGMYYTALNIFNTMEELV